MIESVQIPTNLEIRFISDEKGYGMFTTTHISKGDMVEMCYCIIHDKIDVNWVLSDYLFNIGTINKEVFLPLGYGAIYNHSNTPNLEWRRSVINPKIVLFIAITDIQPEEELTHNYGDNYWKSKEIHLI